jgi:hypothetical protein
MPDYSRDDRARLAQEYKKRVEDGALATCPWMSSVAKCWRNLDNRDKMQ